MMRLKKKANWMGEEKEPESRLYRVIFGSARLFVLLYAITIALFLYGFNVLGVLFSNIGFALLLMASFLSTLVQELS